MLRASRLWVFYAAMLLLMSGCKVELYRAVPEREANLMVSILLHHGIDTLKEEGKGEGFYSIWVEEDDFSHAVEMLAAQGYPRRMHPTLAQLFQPSGLVPTPFEQRVRYIYGLSEELSHTISLFDGVIDTRVHVALPEEVDNKKDNTGRVSIYVRYDQSIDFDNLIPQLKKLAADSIERISYDNVEVFAAPAYLRKVDNQIISAYKFPAGIRVLPEYYGFFITLIIAILLILIQAIAAAIWFYWLWQRTLKSQPVNQMPALPGETPLKGALNIDESADAAR